ncbi:MarR family winged helix-turn-helix transcriptional regulator [Kitasatospora sp. NPDC098652]|uniref:MarR family winged helix-turn-helix transcriptional regulator n=1 Tax=Kitasatospora sp. NPDC098652 TaxID=3364095 RepID=UPI003816490D
MSERERKHQELGPDTAENVSAAEDPNAAEDTSAAAVERAMVALRHSQTRRSLGRIARPEDAGAIDPTLFGVLDAVEAHPGRCAVTDVATAVGVDQPRASRLVLRAVGQGWLERGSDPRDARRTLLALTPAGRAQVEAAHRMRRVVFAQAMAGWSESDRTAFARLITAFVADFARTVADRR